MVSPFLHCNRCGAVNRAQAKFCVVCGQPLQGYLSHAQTTSGGSVSNFLTGLLPITHLLKQRYRIISQLGKGGFGAVYKAEDILFGNALRAVKEMSQSSLNVQELNEAIDAFKREAVLLAGLMHQNLPRIYDHFTDGGRWYLVMDVIEGETLEDHLSKAKGGRLSHEEVLQIGIQLCTVLDYLHTRQPPIIFRDLKPTNVMLTPEGHLYLIDFGIARHFKPGKTKDTIILGTPGYVAPEQYGQAQTTPSADIYSLGATLYQMLSGIDPSLDPFQFAPLQLDHRPGSSELETLITQMLEMKKDKRPTSMAAVKKVLQSISMQLTTRQINPTQPASWPTTATSLPGTAPKTKKQWLNEGETLYDAKRYEEALASYDHAILLDPNDVYVYKAKGIALYHLERYTEALAAYDRAILLDPNDPNVYNNKGYVLSDLQRYQEALTAYDLAIRLDPNIAYAYNGKGNAFYNLQRYQEALTAYDLAIQLDPNYTVAYNNKGDALSDLQCYQEALAAYDRTILLDPNFAYAYYGKGDTLCALARYQEALTAFNRAIQLDSKDASAYNGKGKALYNLQRYEEALAAYEHTILLDPNFASAYSGKGVALCKLRRYQEALVACERAILLDPNNAIAHNNKGLSLSGLKRYHDALATYEYAILLDPNLSYAYNGKGNALFNLQRYQEALAAYDCAIQLNPYYARAYNSKGNTLTRLRRSREAHQAYSRARQLGYNG